MKTVVIFLLICNTAFSQSPTQIIYKSESDIYRLMDTLLATTKYKYTLEHVDSVYCKSCLDFTFSNGIHKLNVFYYKDKTGGNYDLGISDTFSYRLGRIKGFYQDLFPYWKKYYQPDADVTTVQQDGHGKLVQLPDNKRAFIVSFNKSANVWYIECKVY